MIIAISGKMGSGKDSLCKIIQELRPQYNFENKKFSDKVKQCAAIILGVPVPKFEDQEFKKSFLKEEWSYDRIEMDNEAKIVEWFKEDMSVRKFLQLFATDACRNNVHENFWVNALFSDYNPQPNVVESVLNRGTHKSDPEFKHGLLPNWIITDVRFRNEVNYLNDLENSYLIRINRKDPNRPQPEHSSETQLDNYDFYWTLDNNGTLEELKEKTEKLLNYWEI